MIRTAASVNLNQNLANLVVALALMIVLTGNHAVSIMAIALVVKAAAVTLVVFMIQIALPANVKAALASAAAL